MSPDFIEQVVDYHAEKIVSPLKLSMTESLYSIAFDRPCHTLEQVFAAVAPWERTGPWFKKCGIVLKQILLSLQHLHEHNLVHGHLDPSSIGKYGNTWKLMNIGLAARVGDTMRGCLRSCAPPESVTIDVRKGASFQPISPNRVQFANQQVTDEADEESVHYGLSCCLMQDPLNRTIPSATANSLVFSPDKVHVSWDVWGLGLIMVQLFVGSCPYLPNFGEFLAFYWLLDAFMFPPPLNV